MKYVTIILFVFIAVVAISYVSAEPIPWNPFKELERAGQNIRDAIISAGPAVDVVARAQKIARGEDVDEDE
ncbi:Cecropin-A [Papilio xuthus]|uniref:Cecropin-A n=1 Tax=Papilio xuthus TaxID=66420 RepID=A0A194QJL7_PAPXU|nr:Cecropin-A [Papilio xuthus]